MKIKNIKDVETFLKVVNECEGGVTLTSVYGDKYNLTATYILSKETARRKSMNKKVLKVGNLSTGNSQAGTIYRTWGGFPLHCVPELTDMHLVI